VSADFDVFSRDAAADARAFRLQHDFRMLLDAMARPGEMVELAAPSSGQSSEAASVGLAPSTLSLCDVLLDAGTSVAAGGARGEQVARALGLRTHAAVAPVQSAAFCVIPLDVRAADVRETVASLSPGTLVSPHLGATCVVECSTLLGHDRSGRVSGAVSGSRASACWRLSGPGISDTSRFQSDRVEVVEQRIARADEFPCGIDLVFVDAAGHVVCLPRSTSVEYCEDLLEEVPQWDM